MSSHTLSHFFYKFVLWTLHQSMLQSLIRMMLYSMYQTLAAIQMAHILICFNISCEPLLVVATNSIQPLYSNNPLIEP